MIEGSSVLARLDASDLSVVLSLPLGPQALAEPDARVAARLEVRDPFVTVVGNVGLTRDDVRELAEMLEKLAGRAVGAEHAEHRWEADDQEWSLVLRRVGAEIRVEGEYDLNSSHLSLSGDFGPALAPPEKLRGFAAALGFSERSWHRMGSGA